MTAKLQEPADDRPESVLRGSMADLSALPPLLTPRELAAVLRTTEAALAQDRYRQRGVPYVKFGNRVRYLCSDVHDYLLARRSACSDVA